MALPPCRALKHDMDAGEIGDALWDWLQCGNTRRDSGVRQPGCVDGPLKFSKPPNF